MSDTPPRPGFRPARRIPRPAPAPDADRHLTARPPAAADDAFFRHLVSSMRNGVIAFHRDGKLALMNDEAYRIFGITRAAGDVGRSFSEVLRERPAAIRVLATAF